MKTYLYVKRHIGTGLLYFGKTVKNPYKYNGSGLRWKRHLKKHGAFVETLNVWEFDNVDDAEVFALAFSEENNIVASKEWANIIEENGKDGAPKGHKGHNFTEQQRKKMSDASKERWECDEYRERVAEAHRETYRKGRSAVLPEWTDDRKRAHSERISEIYKTNPEVYKNAVAYSRQPKSESHRKNISMSLAGKRKSQEHKDSLSWSKILRSSPDVDASDFEDFKQKCLHAYSISGNISEVARLLNVGWAAVKKVISNNYLLKEE